MAEIQTTSTVILQADVTYVKDGDFRTFDVRFWPTGENKELFPIIPMEGDNQGSNVYRIQAVRVQTSEKVNWNVEVRVRNTSGTVSGWVTDDDTATPADYDVDVSGVIASPTTNPAADDSLELGDRAHRLKGIFMMPGTTRGINFMEVGPGSSFLRLCTADVAFGAGLIVKLPSYAGTIPTATNVGSAGKYLKWATGGASTWEDLPAATPHVLATTGALPSEHTVSGLTYGPPAQVLKATTATNASFALLAAADIPDLATSKITSGTLAYDRGGTGQSTWAKGDILYASAADTLALLAIGNTDQVLAVSGSDLPTWVDTPAHGLTSHTDVGLSSPQEDHFLRYSSGEWVNEAVSIPVDIADLDDVEITALAANEVLLSYNTGDSNYAFRNRTFTEAGIALLASPTFTGTVTLPATVNMGAVAADATGGNYLVLETGTIKQRTAVQLRSDVGAAPITSPTFLTSITIPSTADDGTYTGIVTNDSGVLKYRTKAQLLSDILADEAVTNTKLAHMGSNTVKVRAAGTVGDPSDLLIGTNSFLGRVTGTVESINKSEALGILNVADGADVTATAETSHSDVLVDGDFGAQGFMKRGASPGAYSIQAVPIPTGSTQAKCVTTWPDTWSANQNLGTGDSVTFLKMQSRDLFFDRLGGVGGIEWYSDTYTAWVEFMASCGSAGQGPNANLTPGAGTLVTSWALHSFIENQAGYGWMFSADPNTDTTPTPKFEIRASDGAFKSWGAGTIAGALAIAGAFTGATTGAFSSTVTWSGGGSAGANTAYAHSQVVTGNPHVLDAADVGAAPADHASGYHSDIEAGPYTTGYYLKWSGSAWEDQPGPGAPDYLSDIGDVAYASLGASEILFSQASNGGFEWENKTLAEAGIAPIASPSFTGNATFAGSITGTDSEGAITGFKTIKGRSTDGLLRIEGGTASGLVYIQYGAGANVTFFQGAATGENRSVHVYGYKIGVGVKELHHYVTTGGTARFGNTAGENMEIFSGKYLHLASAAGQNMYQDCGNVFYWRNASAVVRMELNSATGALRITGPLNHDGSTAGFFNETPVTRRGVSTYDPSGLTECETAIKELQDGLIALGLFDSLV